MSTGKAKKTSLLGEFFCNASDQRKRAVYSMAISKAKESQLQVEENAKAITMANRQEKANA